LQHKKPIPLLYIKALQGSFGDDDLSILVRDVDGVAGLKAAFVQPLAA